MFNMPARPSPTCRHESNAGRLIFNSNQDEYMQRVDWLQDDRIYYVMA